MAKQSWKTQRSLIEGNSNFHEELRQLFLVSRPYNSLNCYQEVPLIEIIPGYTNPLHRVDWYIPFYNVVIELHGVQHYKPTSFTSNISYEDKMRAFKKGLQYDADKQLAIETSGIKYISIPYKMYRKLTIEYINNLILDGVPNE